MPVSIKEDKYRRPSEQLEEHYQVEKRLAEQLRNANKAERKGLYTSLYDQLYTRVTHVPKLKRKADPEATAWVVAQRLQLLSQYLKPDLTFLEIGPGDCSLSVKISRQVKQVYALDVSNEITKNLDMPDNFELIISDGCNVPVPAETVQLAYSHQLMEHLHPEDAEEQLSGIYQAIAPGGKYICITPNRLSGPHDISRYFDDVATGFHLKEYTVSEIYQLFKQVGFSKVVWVKNKGKITLRFSLSFATIPFIKGLEWGLDRLPFALRRKVANTPLLFRGMTIIGTK